MHAHEAVAIHAAPGSSAVPVGALALLPIAVLDYKNHRDGPDAEARRETPGRRWSLPKKNALRFLLALSADPRLGKV